MSCWTAEAKDLPFSIGHALCLLSLSRCLSTISPDDTAARPEGATTHKGDGEREKTITSNHHAGDNEVVE
jgi:hypothetical protein